MGGKNQSVVGVVLVAILAITSIAYAAHTTINTDDGQVDPNWANVSVLSNDGDDISDDNYDIDQAWVANESDNSAFYFRVSLVGSGQLPHDYSSFEARLDCDRNGSFQDSADVVVYYAIEDGGVGEELVECQGSSYFDCDYGTEPNNSDTNAATFGEEISATSYNYEWRADVDNGEADWSQCLGTIDVQFVSLDANFAVQDSTSYTGYNAPTAVNLTTITAKQGNGLPPALLLGAAVLVLIICGWLVLRASPPPNKHSNSPS